MQEGSAVLGPVPLSGGESLRTISRNGLVRPQLEVAFAPPLLGGSGDGGVSELRGELEAVRQQLASLKCELSHVVRDLANLRSSLPQRVPDMNMALSNMSARINQHHLQLVELISAVGIVSTYVYVPIESRVQVYRPQIVWQQP
jgi:hypothetical protein